MISSELPEVLGMADRVLVMHEGRDRPRAHARGSRRGERRPRRDGEGERCGSASTQAAPTPAPAEEKTSWIDAIVRASVSLIGVLAVCGSAVSIAEPRFLNVQNLRDILVNVEDHRGGRRRADDRQYLQHRPVVGSILGITAFATGVMFADHNVPIPWSAACSSARSSGRSTA